MKSTLPTQSGRWPTIGYLGGSMVLEQPWQAGLLDAASSKNINLIIFSGGVLESPNSIEAQRSKIFELAGKQNIDGLIIGSDFLGHYAGVEKIRRFCERYRPLPVVKYEPLVEGFPTLLCDFYQGMYDLVCHLIEIHQLSKIAYITGPEQSHSIRDRFRAYQDALQAHGIPFEERLVVAGSISATSGEEAVRVLLDQRKLRPGVDVQAIVGFYDSIAASALQALEARAIAVPDDLAVVGFDDDEVAYATNPRLTTVRLPFYDIARWGVDTLAAILNGNAAPDVTALSPSLVIRQSCGCRSDRYVTGPTAQREPTVSPARAQTDLHNERTRILSLILVTSGTQNIPSLRRDVETLLDMFIAECSDRLHGSLSPLFTEELQAILGRMRSIRYNIEMIYAILAVLQQEFERIYQDLPSHLWIRYLFQQAHIIASDVIVRFLIREKNQATYLDNLLHELNQELATTLEVHNLVEVLARHLPRLGIPACYLSLYENPERPVGPARLVLAYGRHGRIALPHEGRRFAAMKLIPDSVRDLGHPASLVVLPLFHREEQMGFVVFETGPNYGGLYEALREQISSALKRIQLHGQMVDARRKAEEANALKSRFLSIVAHELRTPLSVIVSLSALLLENTQGSKAMLPDKQRQDLETIYSVCQHLDRLVLDVLDLGRSQLGQLKMNMQPLDLGELLREVALVGEQMAQEKLLTWRMYVPASLPAVHGDRTRLEQILLNLVSNATKFTLVGEVALLVTIGDREITIAISDTGLGIPQIDQETIFDEFHQSERTSARGFGGMGLGLAITRRLVELHGGRIHLISSGEEGKGTTFYFTLPILQEAMLEDVESEDSTVVSNPLSIEATAQVLRQLDIDQHKTPPRSPVVLVVDDEIEMLRLHTRLLREHIPDVRLLEACNGRQALAVMSQTPPDLILLDLMMPELDGFGVLEAMQTNDSLRAIPVIIMTGQVLPEEIILQLDRCVASILGKGLFSVDETLERIASLLARGKRPGNEPQRIARRALAFVHEKCAEPITRSEIAAHVNVNERYLTHCFREEFGVTPMEYLNRYRVKIARQLLDTQNKSITEIGLAAGFSSSAHFSRVFHQHTGQSPREYLRSGACLPK